MQKAGLILAMGMLCGCQGFIQGSADILGKAGEMLSNQAESLRNWSEAENQEQFERELNALFEQPYIDPLTHYLARYSDDSLRENNLRRVLIERDRRCAEVEDRYAKRPATLETLALYRAGYAYSCAKAVERFALRVAQASNSTPRDTPVTLDASSTDSQTQARNTCYLLTTIRNYSDARAACLPPAQAGDPRAQYNLAVIARTLRDYTSARQWAERAAPKSPEAAYLLGQLHARGEGVPQDDTEALRWLLLAAEAGHADAQFASGRHFAHGLGTNADAGRARYWFQRAAENEQAQAQAALGLLYLRGDGVEASALRARTWLVRAARQGEASAQRSLGDICAEGLTGEVDRAQALVWYELAAQNGSADADSQANALRASVDTQAHAKAQIQVRQILEGGR